MLRGLLQSLLLQMRGKPQPPLSSQTQEPQILSDHLSDIEGLMVVQGRDGRAFGGSRLGTERSYWCRSIPRSLRGEEDSVGGETLQATQWSVRYCTRKLHHAGEYRTSCGRMRSPAEALCREQSCLMANMVVEGEQQGRTMGVLLRRIKTDLSVCLELSWFAKRCSGMDWIPIQLQCVALGLDDKGKWLAR